MGTLSQGRSRIREGCLSEGLEMVVPVGRIIPRVGFRVGAIQKLVMQCKFFYSNTTVIFFERKKKFCGIYVKFFTGGMYKGVFFVNSRATCIHHCIL